jgi:hypothetical protein
VASDQRGDPLPDPFGNAQGFDETLASHLGPNATDQDFPAEDLTPDFDHYDNDHDLDPDHGDLEVTPEMGDNYLNAEISVPQGGTLMKGRVTAQKRDKDGNLIGLANANPNPSLTRVSTRLHLMMVMRL